MNFGETIDRRGNVIPLLAMSVPAAARATGRSRARMFELVKVGAIKAKKEGASTLITVEELKRWLDSLTERPIGEDDK